MNNLLPKNLLVKCIAFKDGDQWIGVCLNFNLAAQGTTFIEVKNRLDSQIKSYINEAFNQDQEHVAYLLNRKAPFVYQFRFWLAKTLHSIKVKFPSRDYETSLPLKLA